MKQDNTGEHLKQQDNFSDEVIAMAKRLGINSRKLHRKAHTRLSPSPEFIRYLYAKRFKNSPDSIQNKSDTV